MSNQPNTITVGHLVFERTEHAPNGYSCTTPGIGEIRLERFGTGTGTHWGAWFASDAASGVSSSGSRPKATVLQLLKNLENHVRQLTAIKGRMTDLVWLPETSNG